MNVGMQKKKKIAFLVTKIWESINLTILVMMMMDEDDDNNTYKVSYLFAKCHLEECFRDKRIFQTG